MRKTSNGKAPLTMQDQRELLSDVRAGISYAKVAESFGVSKERVRQIVIRLDPALVQRRKAERQATPSPSPVRYCVVHKDRKLKRGRRKYCSDSCAEAMRVLKFLTDYRIRHLDLVARRGGWNGVRPESHRKQILHKSSKAYKTLKKAGLLERLPKRVEIR